MAKNTFRTTDQIKSLTLLLSLAAGEDIADHQGKRYRLTIPLNALVFDNHGGEPAHFYAITDFHLGSASTPNPGDLALTYRGRHEYVGSDDGDPRQSVISRLVFDLDVASDAIAFEDVPLVVKGLNRTTDMAAPTLPSFTATPDPIFEITDLDGGAIPVGFAFEEVSEVVSGITPALEALDAVLVVADGELVTSGGELVLNL